VGEVTQWYTLITVENVTTRRATPVTPRLREFALAAHVTCSIGWLGAVAGFLALAMAALRSRGPDTIRAAYVAMELTGWYVIVPFCLAAMVAGLVMSRGTPWDLFRPHGSC
jgi:hypothetical protein